MPHDRISAILAGLPDPVLIVTRDNRIVIANDAAHEVLGQDLVGAQVQAVLRHPAALAALHRAQDRQQRQDTRLNMTVGTTEATYALRAEPLSAASAGLDGVLICLDDISHVEEAEQMRHDFVANASHELRSPLTTLSGMIETLQGPARNDPRATERFLDIMWTEAQRMNRLIGDLLSLSRVEADERVRPRARVDLLGLLHETIRAQQPFADTVSVQIVLENDAPTLEVQGDRDQLLQVFHNLVENAVKYGRPGGQVTLRTSQQDSLPGFSGPVVSVTVIDQGEGIDPMHLPRLTERFYRVDTHRSRQLGGTGLGLAIVKHIINRHRGRLGIDSQRGEGSSFCVTLPRANGLG